MIYLEVRLLDDSVDKSVADIVPHQYDNGVAYMVYSDNTKMKNHLEVILRQVSYVPAPGKNASTFFADSALELFPNSIYYTQVLPELLSWRGYNAVVKKEVHKSVYFDDFFGLDVIKAVGADGTYTNEKGETIVKYVPKGFVAYNTTNGKVVAAGRYLNANITKEGAEWTLVENPHEESTPEERQASRGLAGIIEDYHPGMEEEIYHDPSEERGNPDYDKDHHQIPLGTYTPPKDAVTLQEFYRVRAPSGIPAEGILSSGMPTKLMEGLLVYSPQTGQAFDSELWPPEGVDLSNTDIEWYTFTHEEGLSDQDKDTLFNGGFEEPIYISSTSKGLVQSKKGLDVSFGTLIKRSKPTDVPLMTQIEPPIEATNIGKIEQATVERVKVPVSLMTENPEWKGLYDRAVQALSRVKSMTIGRVSSALAGDIKSEPVLAPLKFLKGLKGSFKADLFPYQRAVVLALTEESQYEAYGGPKGWHGHFLNVSMGLGKTAMTLAASMILRNKGRIVPGKQFTMVTAPSKNIRVWAAEINKFTSESAFVVDGDRSKRVAQWQELVQRARSGNLPNYVIVGSSKFRMVKTDKPELDRETAWETGVDAQYMKLLAAGGKLDKQEVAGGHVGIMIMDESSLAVNPETNTYAAVSQILDSVYEGKGIVWTLNGTISGNSSTDTVSELSFINKIVRDNYRAILDHYTKTNYDADVRDQKALTRRIWKDIRHLVDFMRDFGHQIYHLSARSTGLKSKKNDTEDLITPLGSEWYEVYVQASSKLQNLASKGQGIKGLLSLLIGASYGAVPPIRMIEYDIGFDKLMKDTSAKLTKSADKRTFKEQVQEFINRTTAIDPDVGSRMPIEKMPSEERKMLFESIIDQRFRSAMLSITDSWTCPYSNAIIASIREHFQQKTKASGPVKIGIAGFSRTSIEKIARRLKTAFPDNTHLIQVVHGDVSSEEVQEMTRRHAKQGEHASDKRPVITLVTGAGAFGLSFPSSRSFRSPTWNFAKGAQYEARFHRNLAQEIVNTVVVPSGISQRMRELEKAKADLADDTVSALLSRLVQEALTEEDRRSLEAEIKSRMGSSPEENDDNLVITDNEDELVVRGFETGKIIEQLARFKPIKYTI